MRSPWPRDGVDRLIGLAPAAAVAVAEGAWVSVVHAAVAIGILQHQAGPGVAGFVLAAAAGVVVARRVPGRGAAASLAVVAVVAGAGVLGWLADPAVRAAVGAAGLSSAVALNPAGWLLALAAWRGTRHRDPATEDLAVGSLLAWGVPGLAIPWLLGTSIDETRGAFVGEALLGTLLFVAGGLIAIGLTRLDAVQASAGVERRRSRAWAGIVVGVVTLVVAVGVPAAILLDVPIGALVHAIAAPFEQLGGAIIGAISGAIGTLPGGGTPAPTPGPEPGPGTGGQVADWVPTALGAAILALFVAILVAILRQASGALPATAAYVPPPREERRFVVPRPALRLTLPSLPRVRRIGRVRPRSAAAAYAALMADLADDADRARLPDETPRRHAARLRREGWGSLSLDLLAAAYALERYGGIVLGPAEVRRAEARWRRLRHRPHRARPAGAGEAT